MRYGATSTSQGAMWVKITDTTLMKDTKRFMNNNLTKDELTIYLSEHAVKNCRCPIVTATIKYVLTNITDVNPKLM